MNLFNPLSGPRVKAVVGHYGSGKTEFSLNLAFSVRAAGQTVTLVDLDIVNPFFRSAEQEDRLASAGIRLIAPPYARTGVDLPVLPAQVESVFFGEETAIFDVGGDDAGAAALGRYRPRFSETDYDLFFVVNPYRPYSDTPERILSMMARIESRARLRVTGLVNNANLADETKTEHLLFCQSILKEVSAASGVPVVCVAGPESALSALPDTIDVPRFPIKRYLVPEWLS